MLAGSGSGTENRLAVAPHAADDEALVAAARLDPRAFDALYSRYVRQVYRYCHVRLGSREAAEDATSAVFLKALAGLTGYRPGNFPAWLFRIAANVVTDARRHGTRRPTVPFETIVDPPDPNPPPDDLAVTSDRAERLRAALATLPDEQRAAIELQLAGWPGEQIAAALDRSPEAVRMLRHRAITRLRDILVDDDPTGGRR
ncbi:MAG TPA: sigma-70 family RNA polymerase sigma factor [Thermomicrobiales bacterium]|nr:sigma-70 family RNA polymerase sigma factor [Thermomicrobiales bacterium]